MPNTPRATIFRRMTTPLVHEPSTLALTVNGDSRSVAAGTSLSDFLASLKLDPRQSEIASTLRELGQP